MCFWAFLLEIKEFTYLLTYLLTWVAQHITDVTCSPPVGWRNITHMTAAQNRPGSTPFLRNGWFLCDLGVIWSKIIWREFIQVRYVRMSLVWCSLVWFGVICTFLGDNWCFWCDLIQNHLVWFYSGLVRSELVWCGLYIFSDNRCILVWFGCDFVRNHLVWFYSGLVRLE